MFSRARICDELKVTRALQAIVLCMLLVLAFVACGGQTALTPTPLPSGTLLSEFQAYERALSWARFAGLAGQPTGYVAHRMTLGEYATIVEAGLRPESAKVGLDPDLPVWVVTIRGDGIWALPGTRQPFANVPIVLDAKTGEIKMWVSSRPGSEPDFPIP